MQDASAAVREVAWCSAACGQWCLPLSDMPLPKGAAAEACLVPNFGAARAPLWH